jgi:hypothetical protein
METIKGYPATEVRSCSRSGFRIGGITVEVLDARYDSVTPDRRLGPFRVEPKNPDVVIEAVPGNCTKKSGHCASISTCLP